MDPEEELQGGYFNLLARLQEKGLSLRRSTDLKHYVNHDAGEDSSSVIDLSALQAKKPSQCYNFRRLRQLSTVVVSKVQSQMSLEECKSWTCIVLLGLRAKVQVKGLSIKD